MYLKMYLLLHLFMAKKMQTLKLDPKLIKDLKRMSRKHNVPFNALCEMVLLDAVCMDLGPARKDEIGITKVEML